jgi:hypothetical protein
MDAGPVMSLAQAWECWHTWLRPEPGCVCLAVSSVFAQPATFFRVGQGSTAYVSGAGRREFGEVLRTMCGLGGRALSEVVTVWV